ncbi:hypothetical protein SAMN05216409_1407 [Pseudomonas lutea]|uniref:Uncharacterized protein n=1 Tax=Pseudomonas lutea TaxID=243924 RepID=A0A9X8QM60_9PSED|nr:hypothetical protein SAMN05216409_1407 [Pseudomonas lutea]
MTTRQALRRRLIWQGCFTSISLYTLVIVCMGVAGRVTA